jgi:hypothetical protein
MSLTHWRYLLLDNGVGAAFLNFGINAAIAWAMFHGQDAVPLWGQVGIASDTIATSLILPFLTFVIVSRLTRWHLRAGRLKALAPARHEGENRFTRTISGPALAQAGIFALGSLVALVPITLLVLVRLGIDSLPFRDFVFFKAGFAVVNGILVTPVIAFLALGRAAPPLPQA